VKGARLGRDVEDRPRLFAGLLVAVIRGYQRWLSPLMGRRCRYYPTCSSYAIEALTTHGLITGGGLALRRLSRCHPFSPGGVDHVPVPVLTGGRREK
jgi:putative membrane protein insertion efficiency factor